MSQTSLMNQTAQTTQATQATHATHATQAMQATPHAQTGPGTLGTVRPDFLYSEAEIRPDGGQERTDGEGLGPQGACVHGGRARWASRLPGP